MTPTPKGRWLRFGLRTFFVLVTLLCCWLGYQLNWVRQRQQVLDVVLKPGPIDPDGIVVAMDIGLRTDFPGGPIKTPRTPGPWQVRMFGGEGVETIWIDGRAPSTKKRAEMARLGLLFPEATVTDAPPQFLPVYDAAKLKSQSGKSH